MSAENEVESRVMVNNTVVDNELGGREVTVLPSWEKMRDGLKNGSFRPITWLQTDRVILNTVRWSGAFLCGMGEYWSIDETCVGKGAEELETFFSREMKGVLRILQFVEWDINEEDAERDFLSIQGIEGDGGVELSDEMSTAYGTRSSMYYLCNTHRVESYSFEFNSLVSSYPTSDEAISISNRNRECVAVGLAHSLIIAKYLGAKKLRAIRRYYNRYSLTWDRFLQSAFKHLLMQRNVDIADDAKMWEMFDSPYCQIPIFPYRMQMLALWEEETNWRILQASAHQDIWCSLNGTQFPWIRKEKGVMHSVTQQIFDSCTEWAQKRFSGKYVQLGVVMETVRTFLAEWIVANAGEPDWEPEVPTDSFEFGCEIISVRDHFKLPQRHLIWVCQRELQRKIAKMQSKDENFTGSAALILLFMLGLPLLRMEKMQDAEISVRRSQEQVQDASPASPSITFRDMDVDVQVWHAWCIVAPQDIMLKFRVDRKKKTVSLTLQNDSSDLRFKWQDWLDAAMGCMKGLEKAAEGKMGCGRMIMRADLNDQWWNCAHFALTKKQ